MQELKLTYFGHIMRRHDLLEKRMLGRIEGKEWGRQRTRWIDCIKKATNLSIQEFYKTEDNGLRLYVGSGRVENYWTTEQQHSIIRIEWDHGFDVADAEQKRSKNILLMFLVATLHRIHVSLNIMGYTFLSNRRGWWLKCILIHSFTT